MLEQVLQGLGSASVQWSAALRVGVRFADAASMNGLHSSRPCFWSPGNRERGPVHEGHGELTLFSCRSVLQQFPYTSSSPCL